MLTKPPILDETGQKILSGITRIKDALLGTASNPVTPGSAESSGTEPVFQDDTGRDIITALNDLGTAVKPASATDNGYVSTGSQTIAGEKTFTSPVILKTTGSTTGGAAELDYLYGNNTNGIRVFAGRTYSSGKVHTTRLKIQQYSYDSTSKENIGTSQMYNLPEVPADLAADEDYNIITTNNLTDIPDASTSARGLVSTGSQTFAGTKQFNNGLYVVTGLYTVNTTGNGVSAPICKFSDAPSANEEYGRIFLAYANYGGRFKFRQYSGSSSARTSRREDYMLPEPDASRTSNADYDILTSKTIGLTQVFNDTNMGASVVRNYTLTNSARGVLLINGSGDPSKGLYLVSVTSAGVVGVKAILSASNAGITVDTNKVIITKSSNNTNIFPTFIMTNGTVTRDE